MSKYKYYFRKPKSEITKDILYWMGVAGAITIAATSPYFGVNLVKNFNKIKNYNKYNKEKNNRKFSTAFYKLKKEGCIEIRKENSQIYISLTEKGRKKAGWLQIDALKIKKPKKWDRKWRLVIFDIAQLKKFFREVFRGKLKELGFRPLQKSVWIHPFDCRDEIGLLKDFLGMTDREIRLVVAEYVGEQNSLKQKFDLK